MGYILKKMRHKMQGRFLWFNILLAANMAILAINLCITVKAILFCAFFKMAQILIIFVKNNKV